LTRDIPRKPVAAVGIALATTAVLVVVLCVGNVDLNCMPTSMRRAILRPSTMSALLYVMLVGCLSTNQSCPTRRFGVRVEAQAAGFQPLRYVDNVLTFLELTIDNQRRLAATAA
jgi:hypothetical protein